MRGLAILVHVIHSKDLVTPAKVAQLQDERYQAAKSKFYIFYTVNFIKLEFQITRSFFLSIKGFPIKKMTYCTKR